jgi:putative hydrolase of the HAD superfamily
MKTLIIDFSRVLLFSYADVASLNKHHESLSGQIEQYRILDHFYINEELLSLVQDLKDDLQVCLFTDGNLHEVPDIRERVESVFNKVVTAEEIGSKKNDPQTYQRLLQLLDLQPQETIFVDDKKDNVDAARAIGLIAILFKDNEQVAAELNRLLEL